jgi:hypothetical protein
MMFRCAAVVPPTVLPLTVPPVLAKKPTPVLFGIGVTPSASTPM